MEAIAWILDNAPIITIVCSALLIVLIIVHLIYQIKCD